jgi:hypothetical protein
VVLAIDYLRQRLVGRSTAMAGTSATEATVPAAQSSRVMLPKFGSPARPLDEGARLAALTYRGRQAFDAGYLDLAARAADGALAIDPRSEDAWLLKADSEIDERSQLTLLRTALTINPTAQRVAERLAELEEGDSASSARTDTAPGRDIGAVVKEGAAADGARR